MNAGSAFAKTIELGERTMTGGETLLSATPQSENFHQNNSSAVSRDEQSQSGGGMSFTESESEDDNSILSVSRSSPGGSPPITRTGRRLGKKPLFGRRRARNQDSFAPGEEWGGTDGGGTGGGGGGSATTSRKKRGLFRRKRSQGAGLGGQRPRSINAKGLSLSDTDTRARAIAATTNGGTGSSSSQANRHSMDGRRSMIGSGRLERSFHAGDSSSRSGSSGKAGGLYPAPQPLHRIRSTPAAEAGNGLSQDPDFFPPIQLPDNGDRTHPPSSRGEVRYGDFIRLWGYSSYEQKAGYVGYVRRTNRKRNSVGKGEIFVLPPVPSNPSMVYHESCFKVVDPQAEKQDGEPLRFGQDISLVDDRGLVWNNKDGRLHGRLGPSLFGNGGHMQFKLLKRVEPTPGTTAQSLVSSSASSAASPGGVGRSKEGGGVVREGAAAILYGDSCELRPAKIRPNRGDVIRAPVTHFRRRHQARLGGYLRSDGKGLACTFTIHHAPPRVSMVSVYSISADGAVMDTHTHYKIPWNQELEFELPEEDLPVRGQGSGDVDADPLSDEDACSLPVLRACQEAAAWFDVVGLAEPYSILASARRRQETEDEHTGKKTSSMEVLVLGGVLIAFALLKALATRVPRLFFSMELPIALEMALDVLISVVMVLVVLRQKRLPAALSQRQERSTSVGYTIKLIKCESGAASDKPVGDAATDGGADSLPPMPDSFLLAECGDHDKAFARWKATVQWRQDSGANVALATPHPSFDLIKKQYPTYFHGKDKTGAVIYYEQLGKIDEESLRRAGLDSKQMLWHYMYQMEYLWSVINPNDSDRCTTVLDLKGVTLATSTKADIILFIKQAVTMMSTHYPERSNHVLLISWPRWFDWIFRFVRPLLSESTKSKMTSCTANNVYQTLLSKIDNDQIPKEYGGASEYALGEHPYEVGMREKALEVLRKHNVTMDAVPN